MELRFVGEPGAEEGVEALERECGRLLNAVRHLEASNAQLAQAEEEAGDEDRVLGDALQENVAVIAKYRAKVHALREEIEQRGGVPGSCGPSRGEEQPPSGSQRQQPPCTGSEGWVNGSAQHDSHQLTQNNGQLAEAHVDSMWL